ncbi:MAG: NAD-dependent DNA ligase LigA [Evtepia sp.]
MNPTERVEELCTQLNYHSDRYYNQDAPEISDAAYDALMRELKELEHNDPDLILSNSPTQKVGGTVKRSAGAVISHRKPMLSMQDLFTWEEVAHFVADCKEKLGNETTFIVETKIDGLSMSLRYENGRLVTAITRGDGVNFGEDVTENAKVIRDVARTLSEPIAYLELRGEVYMTNNAFEKANEQQELLDKKPFANPRNCAAGTLRQLDSRIVKDRNLSFFAFNIQDIVGKTIKTQQEAYEYLKQTGSHPIETYFVCQDAGEVQAAIEKIGELRETFDYDIDGAVIKVNELDARTQLRDTAKNAGYQVAYKYPPEQKETQVLEIELSVGRTGKITPTAVLAPIRLCGTTVSRATLHNQDFINKYEVCIGSHLVIEKSGDVIPKCVGEVREKRPEGVMPFQIPLICPACGNPLVKEETAGLKCVNWNCPAQLERRLLYFVSRDAMDMKGVGAAYIHDLIAAGYLSDVADLFRLTSDRDALIEAGLIGKQTNTDKLLDVIQQAKKAPAYKLLTGLGIPNVGKTAAKALLVRFGKIDALMCADLETLKEIPDVGPITAQGLLDFFANEKNRALIEKLRACGVNLGTEAEQLVGEGIFSQKTFVITGTLPTMTRAEAIALIEKNGGKVSGSVSKKTSYLLTGESAGSKLDQAKKLDIPMIDEAEFQRML